MSFDPFRVDLHGVRELSRLHADASTELHGALGSATAKDAGVDAVHGAIGAGATGAFGKVLEARHGALQAAAHTSGELSQRLAKAVLAYSRGDEGGAESVRAAAEAMTGGVALGSSGTPIAAGSSGTPIAPDPAPASSPMAPPIAPDSAPASGSMGPAIAPNAAPSHDASGTIGAAESSGVADALGRAEPQGVRSTQSLPEVTQTVGQISGQAGGIGTYAALSDESLAEATAVAPLPPPSRPATDIEAERLTRD